MIKGIGVDLVEVERMKRALGRFEKLNARLFTAKERDYCSKKIAAHRHYAVRFAAKEAVLKAMGIGLRGVKWTDIEIDHDELGKPYVSLKGGAAQKATESEICQILVSLSISRKNAVASAIALGKVDSPSRGVA